MFVLLALLTAFFFAVAVTFGIMYYKQNPEAQLRKRLHDMIDHAEAERAKNPKRKKNKTPTVVEMQPNAAIAMPRPRNLKLDFFRRTIRPFLNMLDERLQRLAPSEIRLQLEGKIFHAGKTGIWGVRRLVTIWCISILLATGLAIMMIYSMGIHPLQKIFIILLGAFVGGAVPFAVLNSAIRNRQKAIRKQLPEFMDILCVSVQAGLSFDGAVGKMTRRMHGPLIDEFKRMQNDVALGMTHQYALTNLAKRCDLEEVYLFTTSIIQAEKLGTSITRTLQTQADNMRDRHRQNVKAKALKAPVKIIFPMVLFIFPSVFVILLFPAVMSLIRAFTGNG
ncbi:MAG: type II secretion system F family protein [Selenomonadaceae bacterium]|nr:type II secretion system F family protein [Selenomonadaceae bacterium]